MPKSVGDHNEGVPNDEQHPKHPSGSWRRIGEVKPDETRDGGEPVALSDDDVAMRYGGGDIIEQKYRLVRLLGEGGMGEVWLAHNETLDIDVAVKLIRADAEKGEHGDRLLREARAAARLGHPAIVRIFDFGKTQYGDPYIVMELLEGEDLATALERRGRLSAIKAVRTILPIVHALSAAHGKGIVHRDIKPENIYLQNTDENQLQPKLVDFGIAKLDRSKALRLTQTGALLGSPLYMSPEQARGDDVDHRGDVWSICVVLYEMICGRPPFEGKNYNAVLYSIIANEPPPSTQLGAGDAALWTILDKAFNKDPDKRPQTMRALGEALALWLYQRGVSEDIAGASIEAGWLQRSTREPSDAPSALSTMAPPPLAEGDFRAGSPREAVETRIVARLERSPSRVKLFAIGAGALAAGIGLVLWLSSGRDGDTAAQSIEPAAVPAPVETPVSPPPAAEADDTREVAGGSDEEAPIPVESLDRAPPDPSASAENEKSGSGASTSPKPSKTRVVAPPERQPPVATPKAARKAPPSEPTPSLKDPFQ